jgi:hypothetical protein
MSNYGDGRGERGGVIRTFKFHVMFNYTLFVIVVSVASMSSSFNILHLAKYNASQIMVQIINNLHIL